MLEIRVVKFNLIPATTEHEARRKSKINVKIKCTWIWTELVENQELRNKTKEITDTL